MRVDAVALTPKSLWDVLQSSDWLRLSTPDIMGCPLRTSGEKTQRAELIEPNFCPWRGTSSMSSAHRALFLSPDGERAQ